MIRDVPISSDSIRLGQFLKFANMIDSGADAKGVIVDGLVSVNDVVAAVQEACVKASIPCPTIVSESGRAIAAPTGRGSGWRSSTPTSLQVTPTSSQPSWLRSPTSPMR